MRISRSRHGFPALALAAVGALASAGCKELTCGQGTKQVQAADGALMCIPADQPAQGTPCDADGGSTTIEAGKCVSRVVCDPGTTMVVDRDGKSYCIGTGTVGACPPCSAPSAGKICVTGQVLDWETGKPFTTAPNVRIAAYEPLAFLGNPNSVPLAEDTNTKGCYTFSDIPAPASGLVAIAVGDPANAAPTYELSGGGATVVAGKSYTIDVFAVSRADVTKWSAVAGRDVDATGAYVACYYDEAVPDPTKLSFTETKAAAGVKINDVGGAGVVTAAKYYDPDRATLSGSLTATGPIGCGEAPPPAGISTFSGAGGTCTQAGGGTGACKWETHPGGSTAHVIFIDRFHNCALSPTAPTCQ